MHRYDHVEDYLEVIAGLRDPVSLKPAGLGWFDPIISLARYDVSVLNSMSETASQNQALTAAQGALASRLILKYRRQLQALGIDVSPVAEPRFRIPFRVIDRTKELVIEGNEILLTFPYDQSMIDQLREFAKDSHGHCHWSRDIKRWCLALTEYNLNWATAWAEKNNFEIDEQARSLMQEINQVEQRGFSIELVMAQGQLKINNAPATMLEYINTTVGEICFDNLVMLCDLSATLGYSIDQNLQQYLESQYGLGIKDLLSERSVICENHNFVESLEMIKRYATLTDRFPLVIYELDLSQQWLAAAKQCFEESEIFQIKSDKDKKYINDRAQLIHTIRPLTHKNLARIPLMISTSGMIVGGDRQMMVQCAEKVVYVSVGVYNNKNPQRVKKMTSKQGNHAGQTLHT